MATARESDLERLWPAVSTSRIFATRREFEEFHSEAPWRVVLDEVGRAVVVERWREHLDILSIKGVWCAERDLPCVLEAVRARAREHAFSRTLSPLIAEGASAPYREAGMVCRERIVALRSAAREVRVGPDTLRDGLELAEASIDDLDAIRTIDDACFDEFWRHGTQILARGLTTGRCAVATESDQVIGYTWCTIERGVGTLGRIAVLPEVRGRGVGRALLDEALAHMLSVGAGAVSLCTQEQNAASRALYAAAGLRELPERLVLMMQDV
jgi:ribosomal-protein-alanine N-acetyltransferase